MVVKPNALNDFGRRCQDVNRAGRVFMALFGHKVIGLTDAEKEFVGMIMDDANRMVEMQEEKREKQREYTRKWRKNAQKDKVDEGVSICENHTPPNKQTNKQTNEQTNKQTTEPNNARTREVATASPSFGSGDKSLSDSERAEERKEVYEIVDMQMKQFVRALNSAKNSGNADAPFFEKDHPAEIICCSVGHDHAIGTWKAYVSKLGEEAVRNECCMFYHECNAGEEPRNRPAALNARLKRMCEEKGVES